MTPDNRVSWSWVNAKPPEGIVLGRGASPFWPLSLERLPLLFQCQPVAKVGTRARLGNIPHPMWRRPWSSRDLFQKHEPVLKSGTELSMMPRNKEWSMTQVTLDTVLPLWEPSGTSVYSD